MLIIYSTNKYKQRVMKIIQRLSELFLIALMYIYLNMISYVG